MQPYRATELMQLLGKKQEQATYQKDGDYLGDEGLHNWHQFGLLKEGQGNQDMHSNMLHKSSQLANHLNLYHQFEWIRWQCASCQNRLDILGTYF